MKLTTDEFREQAIFEIFSFYSRQHIKRGIQFDQHEEQQRLDKGELCAFCKDFQFSIPKSTIKGIFQKVSHQQTSLVLSQFETILPIIAVEFCQAKVREIKARLREMRNALEYPDHQGTEKHPNNEMILVIEDVDIDPVKLGV